MHFFTPKMHSLLILVTLGTAAVLHAQNTAVLTAEYDNARTTANNREMVLNPSNVSASTFGKLGSYNVDGQVTGQPLYVPNVQIGNECGRHFGRCAQVNVLYVATMNNSVYAFNADSPGSAPLWQVNLGPAVPAGYAGTCPSTATGSQLGILSTPVIDRGHGILYVVAAHPVPNQQAYTHTLYALAIQTGQQRQNAGSMPITASVPGNGTTSVNGTITLGQTRMMQRPALLLSNNVVYVGMGGCGPDPTPYHGWVLGYRTYDLQQMMAYNSTPNGDEGGIWQAGRGLVGDNAGSVYFETGNGSTDDQSNFGDSFVKISRQGQVQDWYTPADFQTLNDLDLDLATTSPLITPDTNLLIGAGKQGLIYVLNLQNLGGLGGEQQSFFGTAECDPTRFNGCQKIHSLAYWQNRGASELYVWGTSDTLRAYTYTSAGFNTVPTSQGTAIAGYPGGILTVTSAHGDPSTGIVWALTPSELHAFLASDVSQELWNSNRSGSRDTLFGNYHFGQFTVTNGQLFAPDANNRVVVYGLLPK